MRDLKSALIACASIVVLSVAGISIWMVRAFLPIVGVVLLVLIVAAAGVAILYVFEHLHRRFTQYHPIEIAQYGTVLHRRNELIHVNPYDHRVAAAEHNYIESNVTEEKQEVPALLPPILMFSQLLERGIIQAAIQRGEMALGYYADTHELRYGTWQDVYSVGNGGVSGSGKSTTTRFLLFQAVLAGAKLIMVDPHIGDPDESLSYQFSLLPASIHQIRPCDGRPANVLKRVEWLGKELDRRKKTGIKLPALVFVIDEFNEQMRRKEVKEDLSELLLDIEQGGRKFGIFALLIGQRWSAQDLGGADIRTSLASKMAHRFSDEDQAKKFIGTKHGKRLLELETGHWLFYDTAGATKEMITPETVANDGAAIAQILASGFTSNGQISASTTTSKAALYVLPNEETDADLDVVETELVEPVDALDGRAIQVLNMLKEKCGQNEIIEQIWGLKSSDGRPYRAAVDEYRVILAGLASRMGA